jgi:environmental stress-induced protein Ves
MNYKVIRSDAQNVNVWSGGKTIQLFLHPPGASYAARDFHVRISSATVEDETSVFTALPGFRRILMPLDDTMKLVYSQIFCACCA